MKICSRCKRELDESMFYKRSNRVNQYSSLCKECKKIYDDNNKDRRKLLYKKPTKEEYRIIYYKKREIILEQRKKRFEENKEKYHLMNKKWRNTPEGKEYKREAGRNSYKNNTNERIRHNIRQRVKSALRAKNSRKCNKLYDLMGCDIKYLKSYLESLFKEGMSWENYGEWHIDHITPCASFDLTILDNQKKCFHYTNLQPLWAFDNLSKGCKILL